MKTLRENALKPARDEEEKLLVGRLLDKAMQAEKYFKPASSDFLDLREQELCRQAMASAGIHNFTLVGGFDEAERKCAVFLPEYMTQGELGAEDLPFDAINITNKWKNELTHRDYLGALMAEGIRREMVGDILVYDGGADVIIMREMTSHVAQTLEKVASAAVATQKIDFESLHKPEIKVKVIRDTVQSLRLDAIVATAFSMSRATAQDAIKKGLVQVNGAVVQKPDSLSKAGESIAFRGKGKAVLYQISGTSKKGREIIEIHKLI